MWGDWSVRHCWFSHFLLTATDVCVYFALKRICMSFLEDPGIKLLYLGHREGQLGSEYL